MSSTVQFILSLSIVFAVIIGIIRFRRMNPSYYPFIYNVFIVLVVEIAFELLEGHRTLYIGLFTVYPLIDFSLFTWQFHNWGLFNHNKKTFGLILGVFFAIWLITILISGKYGEANYLFLVFYSSALVLFGVTTFNRFVVQERTTIYKNAKFWICLGIIIFYTFFILTFVPLLTPFLQKATQTFRFNLQEIRFYTNVLANLIYAIAVLCIPRKKNITTLS